LIFYTADCHFGHENIIKLCNRPFSNVNEMDEKLIENWNKKVTNGDSVIIAGDMFYKHPDPLSVLKRLKGHKTLVPGNHDWSWFAQFGSLREQYEEYIYYCWGHVECFNDSRFGNVTVCHYPWLTWEHSGKSFMIHGHLHTRTDDIWSFVKNCPKLPNAGVDINNFEPVALDELIINNKKFKEEH